MFFDSGVGGLTVLAEFVSRGSSLPLYYYGDNFHAPYGSKSDEEIRSLVFSALPTLLSVCPSAILLACNTATAVCIDSLRQKLSIPVFGVEPAVKLAFRFHSRVLLLSTPATFRQERVKRLLENRNNSLLVQTPKNLAFAIEESLASGSELNLSDHLTKTDTQAVVLGCTHYTFYKEQISSFFFAPCFDGGEGVYRRAKSVLALSEDMSIQKKVFFLGETAKKNREIFCAAYPFARDYC